MNISEIRQQYPQYDNLSDKELADALHAKFYPSLPLDDFYSRVGLTGGGKKATVGGAFASGLEGLLSSMQTGLGAATGSAEEAAAQGLKRSQERAAKYGEATSLDRVKQAYEKSGLLSAAGEALSQVPAAISEQAPNLAATLGSARLGAMAGSAFGPVGTIVGGGLGAFAPGALQMFGSNIERQAAEQQRAGKPVEIDTGSAALAALPQGALDVAATFIPLGRTVAGKVFGPKVEQLLAKGAEESAEKLAKESLKTTIAKGTLVGGVAEIPTEIAQQMLERAQAGLSLTDEDALKEYGETAYSVGLLAPIGGAGRFSDRSAARDVVAQRERAEQAKAQAEALQAAEQQRLEREQYMQTPEYLDEISQRYSDLQNLVTDLTKRSSAKVESTDLAGKEAQKQARQELAELKKSDEYDTTVQEYLTALPRIQERAKVQEFEAKKAEVMKTPGAQADLFGEMPTVTDMSPIGQLTAFDEQLKTLDAQAKKATTPQEQQAILTQRNDIEQRMQALIPSQEEFDEARRRIEALQLDAQTKFSEAADTAATASAVENYNRLETAKAELEKFAPYVAKQPATQDTAALKVKLQKQLQEAKELGDVAKAAQLLPQLQQLEQQPGLFGPENKLQEQEDALAAEIAQVRQAGEAARQRVEQERAALERIKAAAKPEQGSAAWAVQQKKLEDARAGYQNYQRYMQLQQELAGLQKLYGTEQDIERLQAELRQLRGQPMDQTARDNREKELQRRLGELEVKLEGAQRETVAGPSRREGTVLKRLRETEAELTTLRQQIGIGEKLRDQTPYAANTLADISDARVGNLIDQLLASAEPKAAPATAAPKAVGIARETQGDMFGPLVTRSNVNELQKELAQLQQNPEENADDIVRVQSEIDRLTAGGERLESQKVTTRSRMLDIQERTADAFDQLYFELEKRGQASPQVIKERRKQLERAVITEIDAKLQAAGAPAMNRAERQQLTQELNLLVDDMSRIGIARNADNSYALGQIEGKTITAVPKEGSLSAEQLAAAQTDLANTRNTRVAVLEPRLAQLTEEIASLGRVAGKTGKELDAFIEQQMLGESVQSLRNSIASAQQKERELSALLSGYIQGKNLQLTVVPTAEAAAPRIAQLQKQLAQAQAEGNQTKIASINKEIADIERSYTTMGSDAPLYARALGNIKAALPIFEDQLSGIVRRFSTDLTVDEDARTEGGPRRVAITPLELAADTLARIKSNQYDLNTLNGYIKTAGTPKAGTDKYDALQAIRAQRDALVEEQKQLRAAYNKRAEAVQQGVEAEEKAPSSREVLVGMPELAALDNRLAELRRLRQEVVDARSREGQVGRTPKEQALLDKYAKEGPALITQYDNEIDRLTRRRNELTPEETALKGRYAEARRAESEAGVVSDAAERADMQRQLDAINRQLTNLTVATERGNIRERLEAARDELQAKLGFQGPTVPAKGAQPQRQLPGMPTGAVVDIKPVSEEKMTQARTDMVDARTRVESLKEALRRTGTESQYFLEVAQRLRNEVDSFEDAYEARAGTTREQEAWDRLRPASDRKLSEILYFEALASNTEDQAAAKARVQEELDKATAKMERTTAAYEALSERQRKYEAQEAVRTEAVPGTSTAKRIQAGSTEGFKTYKGASMGAAPKNPESWDIKKDSKVEAPKTAQVVAGAKVQKAAVEVLQRVATQKAGAEATLAQVQQQVNQLADQRKKVDAVLASVYPDTVAEQTADELARIQSVLRVETMAGVRDMAKLYKQAVAVFDEVTGLRLPAPALDQLNDLIAKTNAAVEAASKDTAFGTLNVDKARRALLEAYDRQDSKKGQKTPSTIAGMQALVERRTAEYQRAQAEQQDIKEAYLVARHEQLQLLTAYGQDLQKTQLELTQQLADMSAKLPQAQQQVQQLTKERDALQAKIDKLSEEDRRKIAAEQLERDKERQERNKALDEATKARAALQRAQEGLGLPGTRRTTDTAGVIPTAVQNDIKRRIATATTALSKLESDPKSTAEAINAATAEIAALNQELDTVFGTLRGITTSTAPIKTAVDRQQELQERLSQALASLEVVEGDDKATTAQVEAARTRVANIEAEIAGTKPAEGMRLPERKVGPVVRKISGSKKILQGGAIKLRAAGMSQEAANAVTIAHYRAQLDDNPDNASAQKKYAAATAEMTPDQINAAIDEGNRLLGLGPTLEIIAKREAFRQAIIDVEKAEAELTAAKKTKDDALITLAEDALSIANNVSDAAESVYTAAKALYENQFAQKRSAPKAQAELEAEIDSAFEETKAAGDELETTEASQAEKEKAKQGQVVFRTAKTSGPALHIESVRNLINRITGEWKNVPSIVLAPTFDSLPEHIRRQAEAEGVADTFPGVYDSGTNTTYLVADRMRSGEDVIATLAHEIAGHFGLRSIMGNDFPRIMDMLYNGNPMVRKQADAKMAENAKLDRQTAVEEVLADMAEQPQTQLPPQAKGVLARVMAFIKNVLKRLSGQTVSDDAVRQIVANANRYVTTGGTAGPGGRYVGEVRQLFRSKNAAPSAIVGSQPGKWESFKGNLFGMAGRVQLFDRLGAADEAVVRAAGAGALSSLQAENAQYFMRLADMTTQAAGQFITSGRVRIVSEKIGTQMEERYQSETGANLVNLAQHIDDAGKAGLGNDAETAVTVIIAGDRANAMPNGWQRLNSDDPAKAKAEYEMYKARVNADPKIKQAVDAAIAEYHEYNKGLLDFLVQTDFMPKHEADRLKKMPYVPYYRIDNGEVQLFTGEEKPIRIGNLADNPDLQQLMGDNRHIMPILTSAVQNTFMLTRAGLRNKGTYTTADALFKAGFASKFGKGPGPANPSTVRFKVKGEDYFATIDTDTFGVPAHLIVKGMEGIKTTIPFFVKALGLPANWVRKFVTRSPAYVIRQLIRDPVNAAIMGGVDGMPVLNALKAMSKMRAGRSPSEEALMRGLVVSSNIYTGDEQDMQKFLADLSTGKGKWDKLLGIMDTAALQADAATRAVIYQDSLKKGLTERQAQFRALEAQNFSRRGLSPSIQALSVMVPFFNAQLQGLDVLYRSFRGKMPFSERLELQRKIKARGALMMVGAMAYAAMMQDDEEYMKMDPEVRYGNFFVHIPGVKDPLKIPIPYEAGILFKALPEAIINVAAGDAKAKDAVKGIGMLLWQSTPGVIPVGVKPWLEASYGQTPFGPIESQREKQLVAAERYRENTPEALKAIGALTGIVGVSPLMLEHFVRSYTSSLGVSLLHVFDPVLAEQGLQKASAGAAKTPFIGGLFQSADGRFLIDRAYERMEEITQVANTYKDMAKSGRKAEAEAFRQNYLNLLQSESAAGSFKQRLGELAADERAIRKDRRLSTERKDELIERIKAAQNREAVAFYQATERNR